MNQVTVIENTTQFPRNGEGSLYIDPDGCYHLFFTRFFKEAHDESLSSIWVTRSRDKGCRWSTPREVLKNRGNLNTMSVSVLELSSYVVMAVIVKDSTSNSRIEFFRSLRSDLKEWTFISEFSAGCYVGAHNDRFLTLDVGRIALPVSFCEDSGPRNTGASKSLHYLSTRKSTFITSDDLGYTWSVAKDLVTVGGRGAMEPCLHVLSDKRVCMSFRTQLGGIMHSESGSEKSWSSPVLYNFSAPEAPHTIKRSPETGILYCIHNPGFVPGIHHYGPRYLLVIRYSKTEGKSWSSPFTLADGTAGQYEYANCSLVFHDENLLITCYRRHMNGILYNRKDLIFFSVCEKTLLSRE